MPRGGYHPHAERWGRKSNWKNDSVTKTIRVPEALMEQILELAHRLDNGEKTAFVTESNQPIVDYDTEAMDRTRDSSIDCDTEAIEAVHRLQTEVGLLEKEKGELQQQLEAALEKLKA